MVLSLSKVCRKVWNFAIDAIFPEFCLFCSREGYILCPPCAGALPLQLFHGCPFCDRVSMNGITCDICKKNTPLAGVFSFGLYSQPRLRELVIALKYHNKRDLAGILGTRIASLLPELVEGLPKPLILTAVPLHPTRLKERGYNRSELLARALAESLGLPYVNLLQRTRQTTPQVDIHGVKERLVNVRGAFTVNGQMSHINSRIVLLTDDVVTTGATLSACARVLKLAGTANVYGLTLARG
jgi:ComF family protein